MIFVITAINVMHVFLLYLSDCSERYSRLQITINRYYNEGITIDIIIADHIILINSYNSQAV